MAGPSLRSPSPRLTVPAERLGPPTEPLRLGALPTDERLEPLKLLLERLLLDERLGLLLIDERLELLLDERLELLKLLPDERLELLLDERLLLTELLCPPPPPRLPPPRWANAGVALSARAAITRTIAFEVFISLLLSLFIVLLFNFNIATCYLLRAFSSFSAAKIQPFPEGNSYM